MNQNCPLELYNGIGLQEIIVMVYEVKLALICYMTINAAMDSALTYSASWLLSYTYFTSRRKFESFVPTTAPGSKKKIHQPIENQKPFYRLKWQHHKKILKQINVLLNQPCCAIRDLFNILIIVFILKICKVVYISE